MQMTSEARAWLDDTVRRILAPHPLGDPERAGLTYELMSHLHAAGETHAARLGHTEVTRDDLEAAIQEAGGEERLAEAFVRPFSRPVERVLFWRRLGAFVIDALLVGIALGFVHGAVTFLFGPFFSEQHVPHDEDLWGLMPWGFHDPNLSFILQSLIAVASALVVMGYFTWFEGGEGRSLGKRALGLRVMRVDGGPVTYREAFLRNLAKLVPLILVLDVIVMLIAFNKDKQRVSDKIAETIVVRV